jgi:hypothetical protein
MKMSVSRMSSTLAGLAFSAMFALRQLRSASNGRKQSSIQSRLRGSSSGSGRACGRPSGRLADSDQPCIHHWHHTDDALNALWEERRGDALMKRARIWRPLYLFGRATRRTARRGTSKQYNTI